MSAGDRIIVGLAPGRLILQPGAKYVTTQRGFDTGRLSYLTHWDTPERDWPKKGDPSPDYPAMYITDVERADHESRGCREFECTLKGMKGVAGNGLKLKFHRKFSTSMTTIVAPVRLLAQVSSPRYTDEYLTTQEPSNAGLGGHIAGVPAYAATIAWPDGTVTSREGFYKLDTREWEIVVEDRKLWSVREEASFVAVVIPHT